MKLFCAIVCSAYSFNVLSSSCCVGNASIPSLITMEATAQVNTTYAEANTIGSTDEFGNSIFRDKSNKEKLRTFKIDGIYRKKRHQMGFSAGESWKSRQINNEKESSSGLTDFSLLYNYNLKDTQSLFSHIPKLWLFSKFLIPVSESNYDTNTRLGTDARGNGQHQLALGIVGIKNYRVIDWTTSLELHKNLAKTFNGNEEVSVQSSYGGSVSAGVGYVPWKRKNRLSLLLTRRIEEAKRIRTENSKWSSTSKSSSVDTVLGWSYEISAFDTIATSYNDQTIMGPAVNTQLQRIWSLQYQKRF
jgi:hypothetical protein